MKLFSNNEGRLLNFYKSRLRVISREESVVELINQCRLTSALFYTARLHKSIVSRFFSLKKQLLLKKLIHAYSGTAILADGAAADNFVSVTSFIAQSATVRAPAIFAIAATAVIAGNVSKFDDCLRVAYAQSAVYSKLRQQSTYNSLARAFILAKLGFRRLEQR